MNGYTENLSNFNETVLYYAYMLHLGEEVVLLRRKDIKEKYKYGYIPKILADIAGKDNLSEYLQSSMSSEMYSMFNDSVRPIIKEKPGYYDIDNSLSLQGFQNLCQACMNGEDIFEKLTPGIFDIFIKPEELDESIWFYQTPLCFSIKRGDTKVIKYLIKHGVDVNLTFEEKGTYDNPFLSMIVKYGYTPLFAACQRKYYEIVDMLLERGANLNKALYDASIEGYLDTVKFLLKKGANVNSIGRFGQTALYAACIGGYDSIVKYLISNGSVIDTKVKRASSLDEPACLHAAYQSENNNIVQLLINNGASVDIVGNFGRTLIHKACRDGNYKFVEILIGKGVDINSDMYGATPLIMCVLQKSEENAFSYHLVNYKSLAMFCLNEPREDYFDQLHKDYVNEKDEYKTSYFGTTYKLLTENHYKVIKLLIENGVDLEKVDEEGRTPLSLAKQIEDMKLAEILSYNIHKK